MAQNDSVKEGASGSAPAAQAKKNLFRKAPKQKSDENEIQVLERFDHPHAEVPETKQVSWLP